LKTSSHYSHQSKLTVTGYIHSQCTNEMYCKVTFFPKTSNQNQNQSKNDLKSKSKITTFKWF